MFTAPIGHNASPFIQARDTVADLMLEAQQALDGTTAADQDTADYFAGLLDMARKAEKAAEEARKIEAKPFDDGKAEVQARYKPLVADAQRVQTACKAALLDWQRKEQARKDAEARAAREAAEKAAREAAEAHRAANAASLAAQEEAERKMAEAEQLARAAKQAENAGVGAKGVYAARRTTLVTRRIPVALDDGKAALQWAMRQLRQELTDWLLLQAKRHTAGDVPGVRYETVEDVR
jgi:hypothetical protein